MGLDLRVRGYRTDNTRIGSYISFNDFKKVWAEHLGFTLGDMVGFRGDKEWTNEPLQCFFNHSDCDGQLTVNECKQILTQAKKDQPKLTDKQSKYSMPILIRFCQKAIEKNEPVEFI